MSHPGNKPRQFKYPLIELYSQRATGKNTKISMIRKNQGEGKLELVKSELQYIFKKKQSCILKLM